MTVHTGGSSEKGTANVFSDEKVKKNTKNVIYTGKWSFFNFQNLNDLSPHSCV